jgi:hypothetical protein
VNDTPRLIEALNGTIRELAGLYAAQCEAESMRVRMDDDDSWPSEETEEKIAKIYTRIMALAEVER